MYIFGWWWSYVCIVILGKMVVLMKACRESHIIHKSCHFADKLSEKWKPLPLNSFLVSKLSGPLDHLTNIDSTGISMIKSLGPFWTLLSTCCLSLCLNVRTTIRVSWLHELVYQKQKWQDISASVAWQELYLCARTTHVLGSRNMSKFRKRKYTQ